MHLDPSIKNPFELSFMQLWHPFMVLVLIVIGYLYIRIIKNYQAKHPDFTVSPFKTIVFLVGLFIFYISEGSPIKATGEYFLFSVHMLTMSLTYFIVPPLILGGMYSWMFDPLFKSMRLTKVLKTLVHPALAVTMFNILLSFYHMPLIFNPIMKSMAAMTIANYFFFLLAFVMWWPVMTPTDKIKSMTNPQKLMYVFGASILLTPACALITFSGDVFYDYIKHAPKLFEAVTALDDQKSGGVIMKIVQEIVFACTFAYIFFQWWKEEKGKPDYDNDLNPKQGYWENNNA